MAHVHGNTSSSSKSARPTAHAEGGGEAERTAYAPPAGTERGHVAPSLRGGADRDNTCAQDTGSSRIVIQPTPGNVVGWHLPRRGPYNPPEPGAAIVPGRATVSPPGENPASHRITIISRSITVSTPYIGWLLLPNTRCQKKHAVCCSSASVRLWRPTEDTFYGYSTQS